MTYVLQFLTSIIIAVKLGPYYFGIWSFILLILNYFYVIDFGISNSINILLVQNKNNENIQNDFIQSAYMLHMAIGGGIAFLGLYYYLYGIEFFEKYEIGNYFYIVCCVALLAYINKLLMTIFRVRNRLYQIAFFQSIIHVFVLICLVTIDKNNLLVMLCVSYLVGQFLSFLLFVKTGDLPSISSIKIDKTKQLLNKGWYLFLYNISFYLLVISIRTVISIYYSVEEFAVFSFSYSLANAILLLLEAMAFILFPKIIDKLNTTDMEKVKQTITNIRINYIVLAHGLVYVALICFPLLLHFIPKYKEALPVLNIVVLSIVLYTNCFGYNTFLLAKNQEKKMSIISIAILFFNVILSYIFASVFELDYKYILVALLFSYLLYSLSFVYFGSKIISKFANIKHIVKETFPLHLFLPYSVAFIIVVFDFQSFMFLPLLVFVFFNIKYITIILGNIKKVFINQNIIDVK